MVVSLQAPIFASKEIRMMKKILCILLVLAVGKVAGATQTDTLVLSLPEAIQLAQSQSPSAQSARNTFLAAYWNYRYFRANYLPSLTLTSSPFINKEVNSITQSLSLIHI